ncbi:MAG: tRNA uridine-5-carboxymethylaminomethyl(34) synthesis GTPase MnmE [Bacteroidales bacterium]|nr:tRNA uridine-5-carboxymethylaminomethyl(34) synthesis GTPase MnmE [Bacteroidales bacterium]
MDDSTICALSSAQGHAAVAVIRISGKEALSIVDRIFKSRKPDVLLVNAVSHTAHYGQIYNKDGLLDEVLVNIYKAPRSYTGENSVEIFCHGSPYIQQKILEVLLENNCRLAQAGEYTFRAFRNGKLDLSQAEAVADVIASDSKSAHDLAIRQLKGGFSKKIDALRHELLKFTSLIELELDFSEEDVEFADRSLLLSLIENIEKELISLKDSFSLGNVLKKGIPVAIIGKPNVGKSTLLNVLLNEERAIVSAIPGTTRDAIEDTVTLDGISFRFIDTAGLRETDSEIENMGIEKTIEKINQAFIVLYVFDISQTEIEELNEKLDELEALCGKEKKIILIGNKSDMLVETPPTFKKLVEKDCVFISAKRRENTHMIADKLIDIVNEAHMNASDIMVSNVRHYEALNHAHSIISDIIALIHSNTSHELLAADLRRALHYLDEITGLKISNENVLDEIFSNFCIGK